jgi:hypothetical protein
MDRQDYNEVLAQAASREEKTEDGLIRFSTGVVLGTQPIPKRFIRDLYDLFEKRKPQVPKVWNDQKDREELNPADPTYIEETQRWEMDLVFAVSDFGIMKGTYLIEKPDSLPTIDDNSWVEEREHFGVIVPKSPALRYLAWVTYVAAPEDSDQLLLSEGVGKLLGITEGAVETEMSKFRSDESGETDPPSEPTPPDGDGD